MNKIKLMNKISPVGLDLFGEQYQVGEDIDDEDGILVRSASLHDYTFNKNLKAIARAGAELIIFLLINAAMRGLLYLIHQGLMQMLLKNWYYVDFYYHHVKLLKELIGLKL